MGQGLAHIHRLEFAWMDEVVLEPREFGGIEGLHQPVDRAAYPRDTTAAGMVGEPDVEWPAELYIERHEYAERASGGGKPADACAVGNGPVIGAGDIGTHRQQVALRK